MLSIWFRKCSSRLLVHPNPSLVASEIKRHGWSACWLTFDEINGAKKPSASAMSLALVRRQSSTPTQKGPF
jgi:hypothetical protein